MGVEELIYLKADLHSLVYDRKVKMKDVMKIEGSSPELVCQIEKIHLYEFTKENDGKKGNNPMVVFSILKVIETIHKENPNVIIQSCGEQDFIVEYAKEAEKTKGIEILKLVLICIITFFGAAFTIMAFNNDISVQDIFAKFYAQVIGGSKPSVTELEVGYCIGIAVGIIVFFNHIGRKKITPDPTPIQVEMRKYEQDVDTAFIQNANRKGHSQDVD